MIDYARLCKYIRTELKLSQTELGELCGMVQSEVSYLERGFVPSNKQKLARMTALLGMIENPKKF